MPGWIDIERFLVVVVVAGDEGGVQEVHSITGACCKRGFGTEDQAFGAGGGVPYCVPAAPGYVTDRVGC